MILNECVTLPARNSRLFLRSRLLRLCLSLLYLGDLRTSNLAALIEAAVLADCVIWILRCAVSAGSEARRLKSVVGSPVGRVGPCVSHSYYHGEEYRLFRAK